MITDKLGQEIKTGSYIAYGHALGRCAGIRIGKVLKVDHWEAERWGRKGEMETVYRIQVQGVDDDWSHRAPELTTRRGTLQFPNRIIVLDKAVVPQVYLDLLEPVGVEEEKACG